MLERVWTFLRHGFEYKVTHVQDDSYMYGITTN